MIRWTLSVSDETDRAARTLLARTGGTEGDLSRLVDEAVRRHVLDVTVREIKNRNASQDQQKILDLIDEEVAGPSSSISRSRWTCLRIPRTTRSWLRQSRHRPT